MDEWDRQARALRPGQDDELLVEISRRFLVSRKDQTLGLAPLRLLPARKAHAWILFWTAARRVDDSVEDEDRSVAEWRSALESDRASTLAERCMQAFLRRPEGAGTREDLLALMHRGLDGLDREAYFDQPRSLATYLDLIHDKSATAMMVLDRLLFPGESDAVLRRHAEAFAASTQVGDDCRDADRDLKAGRCFITLQELQGHKSLSLYVGSPQFATTRVAMCRFLLEKAGRATARFQIGSHKEMAGRLGDLWLRALGSGQIRPTKKTLDLAAGAIAQTTGAAKPPRAILAVLEDRF